MERERLRDSEFGGNPGAVRKMWRLCNGSAAPVERADATAADGIGGDIEGIAKAVGFGRVEDLIEISAGAEAAEGGMEEAGADAAIGIDDGGDPGRIAARRDRFSLAEREDAAEFFGGFGDEAAALTGGDEAIDFAGEKGEIGGGELEMGEVGLR